jgi:hypothetical protein
VVNMLKKSTGLKTCYGKFENVFSRFKLKEGNKSKMTFMNGSVYNLVKQNEGGKQVIKKCCYCLNVKYTDVKTSSQDFLENFSFNLMRYQSILK